MPNNFCVISEGKLVIPSVLIKPNQRFTIIKPNYFINYILSLDEDKKPDGIKGISFNYPINNSAGSVIDSPLVEKFDIPPRVSGPILLKIYDNHSIAEVRNLSSNSEHYVNIVEPSSIVYVRSSDPELEQALSAASFITKDPIKIASLACRALGLNIPSLFSYDINELSDCLSTIGKIVKSAKNEFVKSRISDIFKITDEIVFNSVKEFLPNINLEKDNVEVEKPIWC